MMLLSSNLTVHVHTYVLTATPKPAVCTAARESRQSAIGTACPAIETVARITAVL